MWLVTREAQEGQPLVDTLNARGCPAVCVPAIRREALPWPPTLDDAARGALGPVWLFLTSPYAARLVIDRFVDDGVGRAMSLRFAALSPHTLGVVAAAHHRIDVAADGGAWALAKACAAAGVTGTVLYPTSDAGLLQPEQALAMDVLSASANVVRAPVYSTSDDPCLDDNLRALRDAVPNDASPGVHHGPFHAVLFSPSAARALQGAVERTRMQPLASVVVVGQSTARAWRGPSIPAPVGVDIVDFLCSLEAS